MASSLLTLDSLKSIPGSIGALTASQITPRLYLTDWIVAGNWAALSHLRITHVVSVVEVGPVIPGKIEHLHVSISDLPFCNISDRFDETTEFIHKALSKDGTKVLVHVSCIDLQAAV
jgi:atypical dual specificity phosphatase